MNNNYILVDLNLYLIVQILEDEKYYFTLVVFFIYIVYIILHFDLYYYLEGIHFFEENHFLYLNNNVGFDSFDDSINIHKKKYIYYIIKMYITYIF